MGLLDFTSKILTEYKADISDHKAKIKQLTGAQKELAKAELDAAEARNKQLEDQKAGLGKLALAAGAAFAAIKVGQAGLAEYARFADLSARVSGDTLAKLKEASGGLRTEMDLLTFAAKTNHGAFKLNVEQQELTLKAMRALGKQGYEAEKVFEAVTTAVSEAKTDALEPFGISIDVAGTKADKFKAIMQALSGTVADAGGDLNAQSDDAKRLGVQWDDAMSKIKRAIGGIVNALGPLFSLVADVAGLIGTVVDKLGSVVSVLLQPIKLPGQVSLGTIIAEQMAAAGERRRISQQAGDYESSRVGPDLAYSSEYDPRMGANAALRQRVITEAWVDRVKKAYDAGYGRGASGGGRGGGGRGYRPGDFSSGFASDGLGSPGSFDLGIGSGINVGGTFDTSLGAGILDSYGDPGQLQGIINAGGAAGGASASNSNEGALAKMFGPLSDFDAYASGFELLRGAVTSAFQAWMDGSKSIGAAVKGAISAMIGAKAVDMLAESLRHGAYAIGSLAFGDVKGAAMHGTAAVKFAAGAVGLGVLAKTLGGGGGSTTAAGASGGAAPTGGASASQQTSSRPITILLGDEYGADSPRRRQQRAALAIEAGKRAIGSDDGVIYG